MRAGEGTQRVDDQSDDKPKGQGDDSQACIVQRSLAHGQGRHHSPRSKEREQGGAEELGE
jgi:hypothetical protein